MRVFADSLPMRCITLLWTAVLTLSIAQSAAAIGEITITMDDLPSQPVDGLVHPSGVQFGFTVGGLSHPDARYNSGGPGSITFVQDPSIEGTTAGVLSVVFDTPTTLVQFGAARLAVDPIPVGAAVELFNPADDSVGVTNLPFAPLVNFSEAQFSYSGAAVKRMTVDFTTASEDDSPRFAFDNLTFRPVPEPATALLALLAGLMTLSIRR